MERRKLHSRIGTVSEDKVPNHCPGGPPDHELAELLPEALRPDKGPVTKARPEKRRHQVVQGRRIVVQGRSGVLAFGFRPLVDLLDNRADIRLLRGAAVNIYQGVNDPAVSTARGR